MWYYGVRSVCLKVMWISSSWLWWLTRITRKPNSFNSLTALWLCVYVGWPLTPPMMCLAFTIAEFMHGAHHAHDMLESWGVVGKVTGVSCFPRWLWGRILALPRAFVPISSWNEYLYHQSLTLLYTFLCKQGYILQRLVRKVKRTRLLHTQGVHCVLCLRTTCVHDPS